MAISGRTPLITIVSYDISSSRRRDKAARILKDCGERIQYSVFECELTPERLTALRDRLLALVNPRTDRVHFYPVCQACFGRATSIGAPYAPQPEL